MINNDRIVPIQKIDFLSLIGTIIRLLGGLDMPAKILEAATIDGAFSVNNGGVWLANQPVKTLDFAEGVTSAFVIFVAAYDFTGFTVAGAAVTPSGDAVRPDGISLYGASLSDGEVSNKAFTPSILAAGD